MSFAFLLISGSVSKRTQSTLLIMINSYACFRTKHSVKIKINRLSVFSVLLCGVVKVGLLLLLSL